MWCPTVVVRVGDNQEEPDCLIPLFRIRMIGQQVVQLLVVQTSEHGVLIDLRCLVHHLQRRSHFGRGLLNDLLLFLDLVMDGTRASDVEGVEVALCQLGFVGPAANSDDLPLAAKLGCVQEELIEGVVFVGHDQYGSIQADLEQNFSNFGPKERFAAAGRPLYNAQSVAQAVDERIVLGRVESSSDRGNQFQDFRGVFVSISVTDEPFQMTLGYKGMI